MDVKIEIKEERWWQDETAPAEHQSELSWEFPVLFVNKKEAVSEMDEDVSLVRTPRLSTEAVYKEGSTCTDLIHSDLKKQCEVTLDFKTSHTCTVLEDNITSISMGQDSYCFDSNLAHEFDVHTKKFQSFIQKSDLEFHSLCHTGTRPYKCDSCDKRFKAKGHLKRHIACHLGTKLYKCDSCEKSFVWNSDLKRHILCHSSIKPYKCDNCGSSFLRKSNLQRHILCHSGIKSYKCDCCEKSFVWKSDLKRHVLCHLGIKPYKCDRCESSFLRKSNLNRHVLCHISRCPVENGGKLTSETCTRKF